jgi:EpsI family protein
MLLASAFAMALHPTQKVADQGPRLDLETIIPKEFSGWKIDETIIPLQADPQREALIKKIYTQTLSRTYLNEKGERVMLSVAYGGDQSDNMQVHKPEVCYPAQGFQVSNLISSMFSTGYGMIPVKRLLAQQPNRVEPITYWITIGDIVAENGLKWKLEQLKYGLTGKIPDGLIFRVSSLGEEAGGYALQEAFVKDLLKSVSPESRKRLIGNVTL